MKKYYITFSGERYIVLASTPYQACMKALVLHCNEDRESINSRFIISEKGHTHHEDDLDIETSTIIQLMYLSNNYIPQ